MKTHRTRPLAIASLVVLPAALIGCSSSSGPRHAGDLDAIRSNPSPAMHTLSQRDVDRYNAHALARDTNLRAISEDIDAVFYLDRPSRLHSGVKR